METAFTRLVGCTQPLQQAAMANVAVPELAGAVSRAGALGMLGEFDVEPALTRMARAIALADGGAVGMGFFGQWMPHDLATFEQAARTLRVVEIFWTAPDAAIVERARDAGDALVAWQVGSVVDAQAAQDAGCDFVVAQGVEAGGHVRGTTPRMELLDAVLARVSIPVVSAGGIASPEDVAATIAAGAAAVRVGTAFVATTESDAHPVYVQALLDARAGDETVLTSAFEVGWPDAPHRVLASSVAAAAAFEGDVVGESRGQPVPRFSALPPSRDTTGAINAMALYAGKGVGSVDEVRSAAQLVAHLTSRLG
jgi:NAD(P)H-dependent flavin oxidoreductase YrpB (nitropropane dioxygenase family)